MATYQEFSTAQLRQALQLREQIESLQMKLDGLLGGNGAGTSVKAKRTVIRSKGRRTMSPEAREKIRVAQQARWAKAKAKSAPAKATTKAKPKTRGGISAEGRAKLAAAMKARWAARKKGGPAPERSGRLEIRRWHACCPSWRQALLRLGARE